MLLADIGDTGIESHSEGLNRLDQLGFKTNPERRAVCYDRGSHSICGKLDGKASRFSL